MIREDVDEIVVRDIVQAHTVPCLSVSFYLLILPLRQSSIRTLGKTYRINRTVDHESWSAVQCIQERRASLRTVDRAQGITENVHPVGFERIAETGQILFERRVDLGSGAKAKDSEADEVNKPHGVLLRFAPSELLQSRGKDTRVMSNE